MIWKRSAKYGIVALGTISLLAGAAEIVRLGHKIQRLEQTLTDHFLPPKQEFMKVELYNFGPQNQGLSILRFDPPEEPHYGRDVHVDYDGWKYSPTR